MTQVTINFFETHIKNYEDAVKEKDYLREQMEKTKKHLGYCFWKEGAVCRVLSETGNEDSGARIFKIRIVLQCGRV